MPLWGELCTFLAFASFDQLPSQLVKKEMRRGPSVLCLCAGNICHFLKTPPGDIDQMVLGANHSCKIIFDNHILAMTRAMSNSDCNHPMVGPNEPLVQMNCLRGSLWSSEHWFEINCRSSHTQDT